VQASRRLLVLTAGYNGNLGDQAIAHCVAEQCLECGLRPVFVDYERVNEWASTANDLPSLMFGGELGDLPHFRALQAVQPNPSLSAIGGISIDQSFLSSPDKQVLDYLKRARAFFVRDKSVAQAARDLLGYQSIEYAPDIVFSLASAAVKDRSFGSSGDSFSPGVIGINVQAFFHSMTRGGSFTPLNSNPFGSAADAVQAEFGYREAFRALIRHYQEKGYKVVNYSFCLQDTIYFKKYFHDFGCETLEFYWSFNELIASLRQCSLFVASRFHAHVACMIAGLPLVSVMVGAKNSGLLLDMGIELERHQVNSASFRCTQDGIDSLLSIEPFTVPIAVVEEASILARKSLREIIEVLN
jgi:hypothetical protein